MKKYTVRQPTQEEIQKFHDEYPVAVFEDDEPVRFCNSRGEAEILAQEADAYQVVEERLKELVHSIADEKDMTSAEIWPMVHDHSEGGPRDT